MDGRHAPACVQVGGCLVGHVEFVGVPLLYHPEAAELALDAVEVTMMVFVESNELVTADVVESFYAFDNVNRERQACEPRGAVVFILQIELRRGSVPHAGFGAE